MYSKGFSGSLEPHGYPGVVLIAEISSLQTFVLIYESKAASGNPVMILKINLSDLFFDSNVKSCIFLGFSSTRFKDSNLL